MAHGVVDVRRAADRFATPLSGGGESRHCFSFGRHYDPANTSFGPLVAVNDETLCPGRGFPPHRHTDVEIVTWVVSGSVVHEDSTGERRVTTPGTVQLLSAGRGVVHSEMSGSAALPPGPGEPGLTRFIQMWVTPDETGGEPSFIQQEVDVTSLTSGYAVVASGRQGQRDPTAVTVARTGASLLAARLLPEGSVRFPAAELVHLFVTSGAVELETGERLAEGDSARMRSVGPPWVACRSAAELLVWEFADPES